MQQLPLFADIHTRPFAVPFPSTRYQGSKRKLLDWLWQQLGHLPFTSVLDVFGGTGAVSHLFKTAGKQITYNDALAFNYQIGLALIQNGTITLDNPDWLFQTHSTINYPTFIQDTFGGIYFTDAENAWIDRVATNIQHLPNPYQEALGWFALCQACIIKRPYNLFHRANLYIRTAKVERSFGNKTTWDTPFESHFRTFIHEANQAVFDNRQHNQASCLDALATPTGADLVYIDPPYVNHKGVGVDYRDFYHFLEGMVNYATWNERIDYASKHRRLLPTPSIWTRASTILDAFDALIARHRNSIVVISYRDDGIPSPAQLVDMLRAYKTHIQQVTQPMQYALSNKQSHELLLVAQ